MRKEVVGIYTSPLNYGDHTREYDATVEVIFPETLKEALEMFTEEEIVRKFNSRHKMECMDMLRMVYKKTKKET